VVSSLTEEQAAWVTASAEALNRNGSWTGRIHIHKHLFVTQVLRLAAPPFEFILYDYGPYSFDLDSQVVEAELLGTLSRSYPQPGYGPRYAPTALGLALARKLGTSERNAIESVATQFGTRGSQELELIATCLWMERCERVDPGLLVQRVHQAKPKYGEDQIRLALTETQKIAALLAA
jgi:uncharacterized protein YwgA